MIIGWWILYAHTGTPTKVEAVYEEPDSLHLEQANDGAIELKDSPAYDVVKQVHYRPQDIKLSECPAYGQLPCKW